MSVQDVVVKPVLQPAADAYASHTRHRATAAGLTLDAVNRIIGIVFLVWLMFTAILWGMQ